MFYFQNDYSEGCHDSILARLAATNLDQTPGYGTDAICQSAAARIRRACGREDLGVHFLVGGTQANLTVIAAALRPHQAAVGAVSAHINVHESGAVEATGHKVLPLPSADGKITAAQVRRTAESHLAGPDGEHMAQPKLVYISHPTELGTLYTREELRALSQACREFGLYLFVDGARLGYGLTARGSDVTLPDLAELCDVFYIGGTKCGALFGEAVVISNSEIDRDFRYLIKQRGGMLAKGRLLGIQFDELFREDRYFAICQKANGQADRIRAVLTERGIPCLVESTTNQIFPILPDEALAELGKEFVLSPWGRVDEKHQAVRICTSWATTEEAVAALCRALEKI